MSKTKAVKIKAISEADAAQLKGEQSARRAKVWHFLAFADPERAVRFVNRPTAQGAGEVCFTVLPNGLIGTYYFL
jgi:hypothetical protein